MSLQTLPPPTKISLKITPKNVQVPAPDVPLKVKAKVPLKVPVKVKVPVVPVVPVNDKSPLKITPKNASLTVPKIAPTMGASTDDAESVDDSSSSSVSSSSSESSTYITPVYGVNMRVSLDNKYIYDLDFNLVGTVLDDKSIEWIEE